MIYFTRSAPNPLLIYCLSMLSEDEVYQQRIVHEGGIMDAIYFIHNYGRKAKQFAIQILANLSNNEKNKEIMFYEGAVEVLADTIADEAVDVETKLHCL